MNTKMKTLLLGLLFTLSLGLKAQSQDKYEYAQLFIWMKNIIVLHSNAPMEKIPLKNSDIVESRQEPLQILEKMTDTGWELISIDGLVYHLKRKKKE